MPQKFLHLNCFFTCGITASNLATFWSIWFAVGGCTRAPKISASFVRTRRSSNAFASVQLFDLTIAVYGPVSDATDETPRSEEHTSELQSQSNLVCRLLLEKKKKESIST